MLNLVSESFGLLANKNRVQKRLFILLLHLLLVDLASALLDVILDSGCLLGTVD